MSDSAARQLPPGDEPPWNVVLTADYLGVSPSKVRQLERDGKLPSLPRLCNRVLFDPKVVRALREKGALNVVELTRGVRR